MLCLCWLVTIVIIVRSKKKLLPPLNSNSKTIEGGCIICCYNTSKPGQIVLGETTIGFKNPGLAGYTQFAQYQVGDGWAVTKY